MDFLNFFRGVGFFLDFFKKICGLFKFFLILEFLEFSFGFFFGFYELLLRLLLKITKVTTGQQKWAKTA